MNLHDDGLLRIYNASGQILKSYGTAGPVRMRLNDYGFTVGQQKVFEIARVPASEPPAESPSPGPGPAPPPEPEPEPEPPAIQAVVFNTGYTFTKGQSWTRNGRKLVFQDDGNLVMYNSSDQPLFATGTNGRGARLAFQGDGNLVIYDSADKPSFASNTAGQGHRLIFRTNGDLAIFNQQNSVIWQFGLIHDRYQSLQRQLHQPLQCNQHLHQ